MTDICVLFTLNLFIITNTHLFNFKFGHNFRIHLHIASVDQWDALAFYPDPDVEIMEAFYRIIYARNIGIYSLVYTSVHIAYDEAFMNIYLCEKQSNFNRLFIWQIHGMANVKELECANEKYVTTWQSG